MRVPTRRSSVLAVLLVAAGATACSSAGTEGGTASGEVSTTSIATTTAPAQLFSSDFTGVCQGATVSKATPYDAAATTGHKVLLLATHDDALIEQTSVLPADWQVTFDPASDAYAAVDLVACAVRTSETFVKDCDGYEEDDKPTGNVAKLHNASYRLTVHAATTGKELGGTDVVAEDDTCPMFVLFDAGETTKDYYVPLPEEPVVEFLKPFVQP